MGAKRATLGAVVAVVAVVVGRVWRLGGRITSSQAVVAVVAVPMTTTKQWPMNGMPWVGGLKIGFSQWDGHQRAR